MSDGEYNVDSYTALLNELVMPGISYRQAYVGYLASATVLIGVYSIIACGRVEGKRSDIGGCQKEKSRRLHSG
jgi:hypothetical protein